MIATLFSYRVPFLGGIFFLLCFIFITKTIYNGKKGWKKIKTRRWLYDQILENLDCLFERWDGGGCQMLLRFHTLVTHLFYIQVILFDCSMILHLKRTLHHYTFYFIYNFNFSQRKRKTFHFSVEPFAWFSYMYLRLTSICLFIYT